MSKVLYTCAFLDKNFYEWVSLENLARKYGASLPIKPEYPHVTLDFKPEENDIHSGWFRNLMYFKVIGYGNDGLNEGFLLHACEFYEIYSEDCFLDSDYVSLANLFNSKDVLHITMSWSENSKPKNTRELQFVPVALEDQITFCTQYGFMCVHNKKKAKEVSVAYELRARWNNNESYEDYWSGTYTCGLYSTYESALAALRSYTVHDALEDGYLPYAANEDRLYTLDDSGTVNDDDDKSLHVVNDCEEYDILLQIIERPILI